MRRRQWIYGVASDPAKTREMRVLNFLRSACLSTGQCSLSDPRVQQFSLLALKNLEHTVMRISVFSHVVCQLPLATANRNHALSQWGSDQKVQIKAYIDNHWSNADFRSIVNTAVVQKYVYSWVQQRNMGVRDAIAALADHPLAAQIQAEITALQRPVPVNTTGWKRFAPGSLPTTVTLSSLFTLSINASDGSVTRLVDVTTGRAFAGPLGRVEYQTYTEDDYNTFKSQYNYGYPAYTVDKYDFLKVNLPSNLVHQSGLLACVSYGA